MNKGPWTEDEHNLFLQGFAHFGHPVRKTWNGIARKFVAARSGEEVQAHWREYTANRDDPDYLPYAPSSRELQAELADKEGVDASDGPTMNKGPWTEDEHNLFLQGLAHFGNPSIKTWNAIASTFVATRSGEEVRDHWREYAPNRHDPDYLPYAPSSPELQTELADEGPIDASDDATMNKGPWTEEEHGLFLQGLAHFGNPSIKTWNAIASTFVATRSGEEVRDHWREYAPNRDDPDYLPYVPSSPELQTELADEGPIDASDGAVRNTGPWKAEEHDLFLQGLGMWGISRRTWRKIAKELVRTRSFKEVEEHAWEYFAASARGERAPTEFFGWPDRAYVPAGTYFHGGRSQWRGDKLSLLQMSKPNPDYGRVLLYMSSHFTKQHEMYFRYCWKNVLARSPLLQEADIAVHLNPNKASARKPAMDLLKDVFGDHNLMVYVRNYERMLMTGFEGRVKTGVSWGTGIKQTRVVMAMYEAVKHKYLDGYDWVIRVNPDVLIRDDTYFRQAMANPETAALLVDCYSQRPHRGLHLNTDFFAVRPEVLLEDEFPQEIVDDSAETTFTTSMINMVIKSGPRNYEFVPDADPARTSGCRVGGGKDFFDSPVVHEHALHPDVCAVPEDEMPTVEEAFPGGWPKRWKSVD